MTTNEPEKAMFGQRLRQLRESRNWTRAHLAALAGVSVRAIVQWERDEREPGWRNLVSLVRTLGVQLEDLTGPIVIKKITAEKVEKLTATAKKIGPAKVTKRISNPKHKGKRLA